MTDDDPRLMPFRKRFPYSSDEQLMQFLAEIDGVDPLRAPVSQDRVRADALRALTETVSRLNDIANFIESGDRNINHEFLRATAKRCEDAAEILARALAAADRVQAPAEKPDFPPWSDFLNRLRAAGWRVGVHNDYRLNGAFYTFWLMTDGGSRYLQGEGRTDAEALALIACRAFPEIKDAG